MLSCLAAHFQLQPDNLEYVELNQDFERKLNAELKARYARASSQSRIQFRFTDFRPAFMSLLKNPADQGLISFQAYMPSVRWAEIPSGPRADLAQKVIKLKSCGCGSQTMWSLAAALQPESLT